MVRWSGACFTRCVWWGRCFHSPPPPFLEEDGADEKRREDGAGSWNWGCKNPASSDSLSFRGPPPPLSSLHLTAPNFSSSILPYSYTDCTQHAQNLILMGSGYLLDSCTLYGSGLFVLLRVFSGKRKREREREKYRLFSSCAEEGRSDLRIPRNIPPLPPHPQHPIPGRTSREEDRGPSRK